MQRTKTKIIPIHKVASDREKLLVAIGEILSSNGFNGLNEDVVARKAGVPRRIIFRLFGGLPGLIRAFSQTPSFWPPAEELLANKQESLKSMTMDEQIAYFFKQYLLSLRKRPLTLNILAWETLERNHFSCILEDVRVRTALEFFEHLHGDVPDEIDLSAIVMLLAAAVNFLAIRSRVNSSLGGIDLQSDAGWRRIEEAIDVLLRGTLTTYSGSQTP